MSNLLNQIKYIFWGLSFSLILPMFLSTSFAQEEASGLEIEEIIVTAQKREESLQDVPIAITAITEQLEDATIRNIADLSAFAPNVIIGETSVRSRGSAITIRGINSSESDKSFDPKILVELDGVAMVLTQVRLSRILTLKE